MNQHGADRYGTLLAGVGAAKNTSTFHEPPDVFHYGVPNTGMVLQPDMVFTIEPMINRGGYEVRILENDWTAVTDDGSLSAQWEHTVRVTEDGVEILTA